MKIITRKSQDRATAHLMQIMSAIRSHDDIELLNSLEAVAELALIIGGIDMIHQPHQIHSKLK